MLGGIALVGTDSSDNLVAGNIIGINTLVDDNVLAGNSGDGVLIQDASKNTIGGTSAPARNFIDGDGADGVGIDVSIDTNVAAGNLIEGNIIGLDLSGLSPSRNTGSGVAIFASGNTVGGTSVGASNLISGNGQDGVRLFASGNLVEGNFIGTDFTGTRNDGNELDGVSIFETSGNTIGGTSPSARNVISGNGTGITIIQSTDVLVLGNLIGTDVSGLLPVGNSAEGVLVTDASAATIGGTTDAARNVISENRTNGITFNSGATLNLVTGDYIGPDVDGHGGANLGNSSDGILITGSSNNFIGGTAAGTRVVIAGNAANGVEIASDSSANVVEGDFIGSDASGGLLGNGTSGVSISDSDSNTIGAANVLNPDGTIATLNGNVISNNKSSGVVISTLAIANLVLGNLIGTTAFGTH